MIIGRGQLGGEAAIYVLLPRGSPLLGFLALLPSPLLPLAQRGRRCRASEEAG